MYNYEYIQPLSGEMKNKVCQLISKELRSNILKYIIIQGIITVPFFIGLYMRTKMDNIKFYNTNISLTIGLTLMAIITPMLIMVINVIKTLRFQNDSLNYYETIALGVHRGTSNSGKNIYYFVNIPEDSYVVDKIRTIKAFNMKKNSFYINKSIYKYMMYKTIPIPVYVVFSNNKVKVYPKQMLDDYIYL